MLHLELKFLGLLELLLNLKTFKSSGAKIILRIIKQEVPKVESNNVFAKSKDVILKCLDHFLLHVLTF